MNLPWLSALLTIASCKPGMGTTHVGIKLASWWTRMGSARVIPQFNFVSLQWTWKTCKHETKWRSLKPLSVCEIITNKDSFQGLYRWDFAHKLYLYIFTGCKIKSTGSCESIMQKRIHVNDHQTIEFLSIDWGFVCFKLLAEIVNSYY